MFGRIQNIDNRVLDNISRIHKPALNKIMITASLSLIHISEPTRH